MTFFWTGVVSRTGGKNSVDRERKKKKKKDSSRLLHTIYIQSPLEGAVPQYKTIQYNTIQG